MLDSHSISCRWSLFVTHFRRRFLLSPSLDSSRLCALLLDCTTTCVLNAAPIKLPCRHGFLFPIPVHALCNATNDIRPHPSTRAQHITIPLESLPLLPLRPRLRLTLIRPNRMQHNLIHARRRMLRISLTPIITRRVRKDLSRPTERRRTDRLPNLRKTLESVFRILVPEVKRAVRPARAECAVYGMEGDGIDGEYVGDVARVGWCDAVAFEAEIVGLVFFLDVLDGAAALDAADGETRRVREAGHDARLPLQRRLHGFVDGTWVVEVDDVTPALSCADDEELVAHVHGVDAVLAL